MEPTGALKLLLLEQRSLIDHTLYPLLEDASLGDLLAYFQSTLLDLQHQEPSFWQLQVVKLVRSVLKSRLGGCIDAVVRASASGVPQDPVLSLNRVKAQVQASSELQEALVLLQHDVEKEVVRLTEILNSDKENDPKATDTDEHFLIKFWEKLQHVVEMRKKQQKLSEEREAEGIDQEFENCSFERLSFDEDFNDMSRSAMSFPCMEDFPTTIRRMQSMEIAERAASLDEFMQTGELFLSRQDICDSSDRHCIAVLDCFRVLHTLLVKTMRHWVYFSSEALAEVLHSTFRLLTMYSTGETEVEAKRITPLTMLFLIDEDPVRWFRLWLLNVPNSRQLFLAMDDSGFVADLLQYLTRVRPLILMKSSNSSVDAIEKRTAQCIIVTVPCWQEDACVMFNARWATSISNSVAKYLHYADVNDLLPALTKITDACWTHKTCKMSATEELEEKNPWFPFRQPTTLTEACQLVIDSISKRTLRGVFTSQLKSAGKLILRMVMSSTAVINAVTQTPNSETVEFIFELCKRYLQSWQLGTMASREQLYQWMCDSNGLFALITDAAVIPQAFKIAYKIGVINEIWKICGSLSEQRDKQEFSRLRSRIISTLLHSTTGVRSVPDTVLVNTYMHSQTHEFEVQHFRKVLGILSHRISAQSFFNLVGVQETISQVITELRETVDFTIALNSPDNEWSSQVNPQMKRLQWLRCCLSSQFAPSSLLSSEASPLVEFISEALAIHRSGCCTNSSHLEDTCCVAFQLLLSLVSSVPSMLECSCWLSKLKLKVLHFDDKCTLQRDVLHKTNEILGPCSFLEKQLCYEFEFIGGPSEKLPQCELFAFDLHSRQTPNTGEKPDRVISEFAVVLQNKILQAIRDGVEAGLSTPMDFVLISQASWELINDLEAQYGVESPCISCESMCSFSELFAKLTYSLVMSKRSRLDHEVAVNQASSLPQNGETFFPTDSQRKLMNRLYKNYASGLSLESSPTLLHCIVKKFGKISMDCFPVTMLMLLYPTYGEAEILSFLSHCLASPSAGFLWPRRASQFVDGVGGDHSTLPVIAIAEGVEIILAREFPQILQAIDQCHCSLLSLVLRWLSQSFWNYFDWENVAIYIYLSILYGVEIQVYIIVAICRHLEPTMRELTAKNSSESLAPFLTLTREPIRNFRFSPWRALLLRLRSEYHEEIEALLFPSIKPVLQVSVEV
ncbi:broad-minded protein [Phytophthora nicotianae]|uniref:Broad-minded protein n=1 Tax=Phytophthora nicotianae TaxID=4792 RepID=A0A0W8CH50_PHYNI|nr:broad-minded protein [Phytophthora nicotianae]KUF83440.1 broad-minded protein [Phytophthora nicotianae]